MSIELHCYLIVILGSLVEPQGVVQLDDGELKAAWESRSRQVHSADFTFTTRKDYQEPRHERLRFSGWDGHQLYFEADGPHMTESGEYHHIRRIGVASSKEARGLTVYPSGFREGSIAEPSMPSLHFQVLYLKPIMLTFRGLTRQMGGIDPSQLVVTDRRESVGGRECIVVGVLGTSSELWVDPSRNYIVPRYEAYWPNSRTLRHRIDVEFERDGTWGWLPMSWETSSFDRDGRLKVRYEVVVHRYTLNVQAPYSLTFPKGTLVIDWTTVTTQGQRAYSLATDDGTLTALSRAQAEQMFHDGTFEVLAPAQPPRPYFSLQRIVLLVVAIVVVVAVICGMRHRLGYK